MALESPKRRLMGIAEAAEYAKVHPSTLRRRIADGQLPAHWVGPKLLKVDLDDVEALIRPVPVTRVRGCFVLVGDTGFEPVTSSVSRKRATAAPIARGG